ncbi:MAG: hypothetical protein JSU65_09700 [Candidatus Zixiibacteriota bacterium]|nr:MAG: hypothetical protein JSU65_09700 [candidate division Zixibacteria bacterium]
MEVFNMDVFSERFVDTGLNVLGYVAAGFLWALIFTAFRRKKKTQQHKSLAVKPDVASGKSDAKQPRSIKATGGEYLHFDTSSGDAGSPATPQESEYDGGSASGRRDRAETVRLARKMLSTGVPAERIRRTLPITEGELAFLSRN